MTQSKVHNIHILGHWPLPTPAEVKALSPLTDEVAEDIAEWRRTVGNILDGQDERVFVVVGPCSIHDMKAAEEYSQRLRALAEEVRDTLFLVMRVYFEKPRTTVGWKGFINDPDLDDSFHIEKGLKLAREFLRSVAALGLPAATEALDPITPQYLADLITWTAIGARTTESQTHRELASGLSSPVGFKNGTDGSIDVAVNALCSAARSHHFLGLDQDGRVAVYHTAGNPFGHLVLRGGKEPNYDATSIRAVEDALLKARQRTALMVDCSHGNSHKDPWRQPEVFMNCIEQIATRESPIRGLMLESHLFGGRQELTHRDELKYGVSITDGCIDWNTTEEIILKAHEKLK